MITVVKPALAAMGASVLEYSPAIDGDAFVARGDSPATKISDVKNLDYVLGASAQCEERPQCYIGFTDPNVYGITFKDYKKIDFGPQLGEALTAKEVDVVVWNTTAPQITEKGFKVLEDDKRLFPAQNIAPVVLTSVTTTYGAQLATDLDTLERSDHHRRPGRLERGDRHQVPGVRRRGCRVAAEEGPRLAPVP